MLSVLDLSDWSSRSRGGVFARLEDVDKYVWNVQRGGTFQVSR